MLAKRELGKLGANMSVAGSSVPPDVIQALVLRKLKNDAELKLGPIRDVVITVPAYFNEPRRKATQDAGRLAGLNVIDIINEPTAAALAYGIQRGLITPNGEARQDETILVYDLGGGTFDVTLMDIVGHHFHTVATAGDVYLGGCDWDQAIANHIAAHWQEKFGTNLLDDKCARQKLLSSAEEAKFSLSARESVVIRFNHDSQQLRLEFTRREFEAMTAPLLNRTMATTRQVLRDAGRRWSDVSRLLLVGGSTRMPMIHERLAAESELQIDRSLSPDECVAHGAAVYAGMLRQNPSVRQLSVCNVNSHELGILGLDPTTREVRRAVMIDRNTPLPTFTTKLFRTFRDSQPSVLVRVVEGGDANGNNATVIGNCIVQDLPPGLPKQTPIEVSFSYETDGRLDIVAKLEGDIAGGSLVIERASGLTGAELEKWKRRIENNEVLADIEPPPVSTESGRAASPCEDPFWSAAVPDFDLREISGAVATGPSHSQPVEPPVHVGTQNDQHPKKPVIGGGWESRRKKVTGGRS